MLVKSLWPADGTLQLRCGISYRATKTLLNDLEASETVGIRGHSHLRLPG